MRMVEHPPGVTCEVVALRLERYVVRTLPWGEALAVAEHVEACVSCAELLVLVRLSAGVRPAS
ncbi:MAG TPA: zf-HC2 domain-containing protein [Gemmatimonadaceae bacterium]